MLQWGHICAQCLRSSDGCLLQIPLAREAGGGLGEGLLCSGSTALEIPREAHLAPTLWFLQRLIKAELFTRTFLF